ncbi:hypothetical protein [Ammoniphilus sp. 3BR4]|uniref:hypothetical protein n=1 Tax=Ammoniphilus sp. 3BR4 TaxID=3158265 RepID=UPI0034659116
MNNLDDLFICTNPSRRDVKKIFGQENYARGIILKNGDVIVWNGEVMHSKVMPFMPETGLHFSIFKDKLEVCWQFESWSDVQERLKQAKKYFEILEYPEDGRVVMDTMFYTHTKKKFPDIQYKDLFQEGFELKPMEE